jgi:hypothetical protein
MITDGGHRHLIPWICVDCLSQFPTEDGTAVAPAWRMVMQDHGRHFATLYVCEACWPSWPREKETAMPYLHEVLKRNRSRMRAK